VVAQGGGLEKDGFAPFLTAFHEATGRTPSIDQVKFEELVSPQHFVAVRDRLGGPAPKPMGEALAHYHAITQGFTDRASEHAAFEAKSDRELNEKFSALAETR
jgi:argininosuccinate lyase